MPAYNATFRTYTHYADLDIEAGTTLWISTRALDLRQADDEVFFHPYECAGCKNVNEIELRDADDKTLQLCWMTTSRCATQPPSFAMRWKPLSNAIAPKPPPPVLAMTK
jgi:hypothetical protein